MRLNKRWSIGAICALMSLAQLASAQLTQSMSVRGDGKTVVKFTAGSGTWTVPAGVSSLEVLVVGGGGGSWNDGFQSGSGAGGMYFTDAYAVTPGDPISVTVGAGATDGAGSSSSFGTQMIAYGGTKGDGYTNGGDQGGYSLDGGTTVVPGNLGMHYDPFDGNWSSGGGAGGSGFKGDTQLGGQGAPCSITGSEVYYAGGGGAPSSYATSVSLGTPGYNLGDGGSGPMAVFADRAFSGKPNSGGGAGGGWGGGGGAGGSGVVIVAYQGTAPLYTVSFMSDGASVGSQTVESGSTASPLSPAPTKAGYTFVEWCSDNPPTTAFNFSTPITADRTLYAKWVINSYTLTYTAGENGTISGTSPQTVNYGASGTPVTAVPNAGYVFLSWSDNSVANPRTDANVSGNLAVTANFALASPLVPTLSARSDGKVVAVFSAGTGVWTVPAGVSEVEVLIVGGGGSGRSTAQAWDAAGGGAGGLWYASTYPVTPGTPVTIAVGAGGASVAATQDGLAGGLSRFGSIAANGGGGGGAPYGHDGGNPIATSGSQGNSTDGVTVKTGKAGIFGQNASGGGDSAAGTKNYGTCVGGAGTAYSITGNSVGYAGGGAGGYDGSGGGAFGGGGGANLPGENGKGGGGGGGAYNNPSGAGGSGVVIVAYTGTMPVYTVTFNTDGGSAVATQNVFSGEKATRPADPTKTGYTFVDWYADSGLNNLFNFDSPITANTTVYAKWQVKSYTLTYTAGDNGTLSGSLSQTVNHGGSGTAVTANPSAGYIFASWSDGLVANPRTDVNITGNITVTANFEVIPPAIVPTVSIRRDGATVATFPTASGVWTVPTGVSDVEVLVVGGGGGACPQSSGAGAGGMYYTTFYSVTPGSLVNVSVGAGGGAGSPPMNSGIPGTNGGTSRFGQILAFGGQGMSGGGPTDGVGGTYHGGNQGGYSINGGVTIVPGNVGGHRADWSNVFDGNYDSGAGAGGPGQHGNKTPGGNGLPCIITGQDPVPYYAGGGGAMGGAGGQGGGGAGSPGEGLDATSGTDGLGGGGGGGWLDGNGGAGGSGTVIVAYYTSATYTVVFESNGGSAVASQKVAPGYKAIPVTSTRAGYTFLGWYSDAGLTSSFNFDTPINANTTLYAKWVADQVFTINLGAKGSAGTFFEGNVFTPWLPELASLPPGSYLKKVETDLRLESQNQTAGENWACELALYIDPTPETPAGDGLIEFNAYYQDFHSAVHVSWTGGEGGPGTDLVDTKIAGADFPGNIDLSGTGAFLVNGFGGPVVGGWWSGTITITVVGVDAVVAPALTITSITPDGSGNFTISGTASSAVSVDLLKSTDVTAPLASWSTAAGPSASGTTFSFTVHSTDAQGFFSVKVH